MDSSLCVLKGLVGMLDICVYGSVLVKKFRNWKIGIYRYEINAHFKKEVGMIASQDIVWALVFMYLL